MKVRRILLHRHKQFQHLDLDLTYPQGHSKAGKPLDKVCLVGGNGTGKTMLLELLKRMLVPRRPEMLKPLVGSIAIQLEDHHQQLWMVAKDEGVWPLAMPNVSIGFLKHHPLDYLKATSPPEAGGTLSDRSHDGHSGYQTLPDPFWATPARGSALEQFTSLLTGDARFHVIHSPRPCYPHDVGSRLQAMEGDPVLAHLGSLPVHISLSGETLEDGWRLLLHHEMARIRSDYSEASPEDATGLLHDLSQMMAPVLGPAGLYLDADAFHDVQAPTQRLASIVKARATQRVIPFNELSQGMRHLLFRLGHLIALYHQRHLNAAIALIDEPEDSLFPDLHFDLVASYLRASHNTQFFFATHSPIVAAQFEPCERIVLEFDEEGQVQFRRGTAPEGDDPNDVLKHDFALPDLMGPKGRESWEEYVGLQSALRKTTDPVEKRLLSEKILSIAHAYNY